MTKRCRIDPHIRTKYGHDILHLRSQPAEIIRQKYLEKIKWILCPWKITIISNNQDIIFFFPAYYFIKSDIIGQKKYVNSIVTKSHEKQQSSDPHHKNSLLPLEQQEDLPH